MQKEELMKLYEVGLIKSAAYVHFALRLENPYCDRPVQVIPKEFALRWRIPEKSVYRAIARLKELGILNIKSGKLVIDWVRPEKQDTEEVEEDAMSEVAVREVAVNENPTPKFSEVRKNSQSCENRGLKPLSDIGSETLQTIKTFQTNQTRGGQEKTFSQEEEQPKKEIVQETVQIQEVKEEKNLVSKAIEVEEVPRDVVQETTKIITPSKKFDTSERKKSVELPQDLQEKLQELEIPLDNQVRKAIASHHISQAYGAAAHVENTWDTINNPRSVFLYQLPKQPIEKLGSRYSEEILNNIKAQNQAIEEERKDPEYQTKMKQGFEQIRAILKQRKK